MIDLRNCSWPLARVGEAMQALARRAGLPHRSVLLPQAPNSVAAGNKDADSTWISSIAACLDLEIDTQPATYRALRGLLGPGPALVPIDLDGEFRWLAIIGSGRGQLLIIPPD